MGIINKDSLTKPLYLAILMVTYGVALSLAVLLIGVLFDSSYSFMASGGLAGALLAGTTFVQKRREKPSLKLKIYSTLIYLVLQIASNIAFLYFNNLEIDNFWKFILTVNAIYIFGIYFMVSLGASNYYRSLQRLENNSEDE